MKPIDFDEMFHKDLTRWMDECQSRYRNVEAMEAAVPEVYEKFCETPRPELDGRSPADYFAAMRDPSEMIRLLRDYESAGVDIPELLLSRIAALGEPSIPPLLELFRDETACACLRVTAANLLTELSARAAVPDCLRLIDARAETDELADAASELLDSLGEEVVPEMLSRLPDASPAALCTYLDLLCNFPGDERIYQYTCYEFLNRPEKRALYASYLGKLGDPRAIDSLSKVFSLSDLNYLDYLEIANAIEMLGGDPGDRLREFPGDPYYESLKNL